MSAFVDIDRAGHGVRIEYQLLSEDRHSPHRDQPAVLIAAAAQFIRDTNGDN